MLQQAKATMYLSAERQEVHGENFRSLISFQSPGHDAAQNCGDLVSFEELTVAAMETLIIELHQTHSAIVIPLVGTLHLESAEESDLVCPGQALCFSGPAKITNPYTDDLINFLLVRCFSEHRLQTTTISFDIDSEKNQLTELNLPVGLPYFSIGKFDGRKEWLEPLQSGANGVFVHVITGAFEVQYRLLEAKDSLFLWDTETIDLEALSNEAIILLIQTALTAEEV